MLEAASVRQPDHGAALRQALATSGVTDRDNTGHGFFTPFETVGCVAPLGHDGAGRYERFLVRAEMEEMGPGSAMGFVLRTTDGRPDCLESS